MTRLRPLAAAWAFVSVIVCAPAVARAQFFSPGPLARPHASLEGLEKCKQCHQEQKGLSAKLCLDCHSEITARVAKGAGFHGHMPAAKRDACQSCHPDHRGLDFAMVDWEGGKNKFQHQQTGWPLKGQHAKAKCDDCHQRRLIVDASIGRLLDSQPKRTTMLGLGQRCDSCHFDEHRGQLGRECQSCHDEVAWKPPPRFNHNASAFPLKGKHKEVACAKCHPSDTDTRVVANPFPAPRATTFMEMKPIDHKTCESCHDDPHKGSLGPACASCHSETGWKVIHASSGKDTSFHDKTQFPLRGGHVGVECRACHGPFPGQAAKFKGLPFAACSDCHQDAHLGQLRPKPPAKVAACDQCHTVNAFVPVRYELEQHRETKFPLEGGHAATACRGCHPIDEKLTARIPAGVHKLLRERKRPERFSLAVLHPKKTLQSCLGCHEDVHRGQFAENGDKDTCASCHETTSFADLTFDHDKDSRFGLTGKHATTPCAACHGVERAGPGQPAVVRYKPLDTACKSCHPDQHQGQFLARAKTIQSGTLEGLPTPPAMVRGEQSSPASHASDCAFCHQTTTFKKTLFTHADARFTSFSLDGKHSKLPCASCHPTVTVGEGVSTVRYRPVPRTCEACHVDFHHGQFKGFEP